MGITNLRKKSAVSALNSCRLLRTKPLWLNNLAMQAVDWHKGP